MPNITIKSVRNYRLEEIPTLYDAVEFFIKELSKVKHKNLEIDIKLVNGIINETGGQNWGECLENVAGKSYSIRIVKSLPFVDMITTLAHEIVHVMQGVQGTLVIVNCDWWWKGTNYGDSPYTGTDKDATLPWEEEAHRKELILSRKFCKHLFS